MPRVPPAVAPPLVLRQTENPNSTCFQARQAARSRHVSHAVLLPSILWRNRQTIAHLILRPKLKNCLGDFEAQITKLELPVLRPKPRSPSTLILRPNQETRAPHLFMHSVDRKRHHPTSRSSDHRVSNMCLTISGPLHQIYYSCQDLRHCPPYHTCHLRTTRQANVILHTR
jgi:hypothetical protein